MKKFIILLALLTTIQTAYAAPQPMETYRLPNGETVTTYLFDDGRVGYTQEDAEKIRRFYEPKQGQSRCEKFGQGVHTTVNTVNTLYDSVRSICGFIGL